MTDPQTITPSKTPEDIAKASNPEKQAFLLDMARTRRDLLRFIAASTMEAHSTHLALRVLDVCISEVSEACSIRLERQTSTLISLTKALLALTVALLVATVILLLRG